MSKVLIWLASADVDKLKAGVLWATNAQRNQWVDEIRVVVFGPSERVVAEDEALFEQIQGFGGSMYCSHVAETEGLIEALETKGAQLVKVGEPIGRMIRDGYEVITF